MTPSTEAELSELFAAAIESLEPRTQSGQALKWQHYERPNEKPTTTRRFRLVWTAGNIQPGGARAGNAIETWATLRVEADYAGEVSEQQFRIADDFHQLGDALANLRGPDNGLITVERQRTVPVLGDPGRDDNVRVAHLFNVRFIRAIYP